GTVIIHDQVYQGIRVTNTLQAPEQYVRKFRHIPDTLRRVYAAMVASLDDNVGQILASLESRGQLENTMIWFISDNGGYTLTYGQHPSNGMLRNQKGSLYEGGIRVPGMLMWKNRIAGGQVVQTPVCNLDILPTLGAMLGFRTQSGSLDGADIGP